MNRDDAPGPAPRVRTPKEALRKHAYGVEAAMRAYARRFGEDADTWAVVGLLHDFDYERYPDAENHPFRGAEWSAPPRAGRNTGHAIPAHASYNGVPRDTPCGQDPVRRGRAAGLITAAALVTPDKKLAAVGVRSVIKKMKDKASARAEPRRDPAGGRGAGVPLEEHINVAHRDGG